MRTDLIRTLLYFDIFSYPLSEEELLSYCGFVAKESGQLARQALQDLVKDGLICKKDGFYCLAGKAELVGRRLSGNKRAKERLITARRYARLIASFPFVEAVMLSGSIAKGYMGRNDDIDYFIITRPGRLWIARSLLVLFKKLFLGNSHRNFCINYFVDSQSLHIREQNRFTATEIAFLVPVYNERMYRQMLGANAWIKTYYPTFTQEGQPEMPASKWIKTLMEALLDNGMGNRLEAFLHKRSIRIIRNKFQQMSTSAFHSSFSLKKNELRYLPGRQQHRIIRRLCWKERLFERRMGAPLQGMPRLSNTPLTQS